MSNRFARVTTEFVCGIDLHKTTMSVCIMDRDGRVELKRSIDSKFEPLFEILMSYNPQITVGVESTFNWYWLIDELQALNIPVFLGHALYIRQQSGKKNKNDKIDARCIADMLRANRFPIAYMYPSDMRATRDLLRRRHFFVRRRAGTLTHIQNTFCQWGVADSLRAEVQRKTTRRQLIQKMPNPDVRLTLEADFDYVDNIDMIVKNLDQQIAANATHHSNTDYSLLRSAPGIGEILALTILYETHTIDRFATPQRYSSYCRVINAQCESAGKSLGRSGADKIGNPALKWAFSEAAAAMLRESQPVREWYDRATKRHGKASAMARLRHRIAVAVFFMLKNRIAFDIHKFLQADYSHAASPKLQRMAESRTKPEPARNSRTPIRRGTLASVNSGTKRSTRHTTGMARAQNRLAFAR
jgi:transposase